MLPESPSYAVAVGNAISADGRVVGGYVGRGRYLQDRPAMWVDGQPVDVRAMLQSQGLPAAQAELVGAIQALSSDGSAFVGFMSGGLYLVRMETCGADFNGDGFLDFFDYDAFVTAFEAGDPEADFSGDGFLDFFDYDGFVGAYETGC